MKTTTPLYRRLRAQEGSWYETQVVRGNTVYGDNVREPYQKNIQNLSINPALFDDSGPQIGIARACVCKLEIFESRDNWPRMASFLVRMRLHSADGSEASEWLPMGVFYTDRRVPDDVGFLSVTAYDGMLLLEQSWTDRVAQLPSQWPITARAAAALLEEATGIELENDELLDDTTPFIGLNTEATAREVWSDIAAAHGCNLQMTGLGGLRLVPFAKLSTYTGAVADLAIADCAIVDTEGGEILPEDFFDLGYDVSTLDTGDDLPEITGVELTTESGVKAAAGDASGYVLKGVCNFSNSAAASLCLSRVAHCFYRPFDVETAYTIDPAAEAGDLVSIESRIYQIAAMEWTICAKPTAALRAEFEAEIDHEYTVQSSGGRALRIAVGEAKQYADLQLQDFLQGDFADTVEELQGQIDGKAETWYQAADPSTNWTAAQKAEHAGDLWYRTTDGTTWRYTGAAWQALDVPDSVFDAIDGKAQIFVTQPTPPYNVGDLWFAGTGADIMTCVTARPSGSYTASDWAKRNKYTDDTAADAVAANLSANYLTAVQTRSYIDQQAESIRQGVATQYVSNAALSSALSDYSPTSEIENNYYSKTEIDTQEADQADAFASELELTDRRLTLAFSALRADTDDAINAMSYYIRYENGVVIVGKTDSPTSIRISNTQIGIYYNNEFVSWWNQDKQYTPKELQIPTGGKFTLGKILFQPRTSGNMSFMWVG